MYDIKFSIGQKVYPINHTSRLKNTTCFICEGKKYVTIRNRLFSCPNCHGIGKINKRTTEWLIGQPKTIQSIHIRKDKNSYKITYDFVESSSYSCYSTYYVSQENLFASKQEAEEECKRRNECEQ